MTNVNVAAQEVLSLLSVISKLYGRVLIQRVRLELNVQLWRSNVNLGRV